jgi:hypothetical protein
MLTNSQALSMKLVFTQMISLKEKVLKKKFTEEEAKELERQRAKVNAD